MIQIIEIYFKQILDLDVQTKLQEKMFKIKYLIIFSLMLITFKELNMVQ